MSLHDSRGAPVSTGDRRALDRLEAATGLLLGYRADPLAAIDEALAEAPDFVMGHCFRAGLFLLSTERGAEPELRRSVEAAEALAGGANERERMHMAAARAWLDGDFARAVDRYGRAAIAFPRDAFALLMAHQGDFFLGHTQMMRDRFARALPAWDDAVPGAGFLLGMHAFGLEEAGDYARAEETGIRALAMNPRDAWAAHAVAHVMEMQGRAEEGAEFMESRSADWTAGDMFAFHNWWHTALFHLDAGRIGRVLALYDEGVRPGRSAVALEMLDAAALLWRLHLAGVDVGGRWDELADAYAPMAEDAYYAFNDAHAMMAFAATGRRAEARRLIRALEREAAEGRGTNAMMTRDVGLPMARALYAFGEGDHAAALDHLLPVRGRASRFGGSHAQRDVISLTLVEAALRAGDTAMAAALTAERTDVKPSSRMNWRLTARARELAGDKLGAAAALSLAA